MNAHNQEEVQKLIKNFHLKCIPNDEIVENNFCDEKVKQLVEENQDLKMRLEIARVQVRGNNQQLWTVQHQNAALNSQKNELNKKIENLTKRVEVLKKTETKIDVNIENEMQKLEEENNKFKKEIEELREENSKLKKSENNDGKSSNALIWIFSMLTIVSVVGFVVGYLYYNRMFVFARGDGNSLICN
jgi:predicted RNase H-like nuclease (RuvC/YqgF family)